MLTVRNNFEFQAFGPLTIPCADLTEIADEQGDLAGGQRVAAQHIDGNLALVVDVPASSRLCYLPDVDAHARRGLSVCLADRALRVRHPDRGLQVDLELGLIAGPRQLHEQPPVEDAEWPAMAVRRRLAGPVCTRLDLEGRWQCYVIDVSVVCYHAGFLDVAVGLTNQEEPGKDTYLALVKKLHLPGPLKDCASRLYGRIEQNLQYEQPPDVLFQGLDWAMACGEGWAVQLMNDQTFNWHRRSPDGKWFLECNGRMAMHRLAHSKADLCCVTSITGPRYARTRYDADGDYEFVAPPRGKRVACAMRLHLADGLSTRGADEQFILYEGYRRHERHGHVTTVDLGVRHTTFGVLYIPDRLAEDFVLWRTDTTVGKTNDLLTRPASRGLSDVIERDFRIMSALGLVCRYHHLKARNDVELEMVRLILATARKYGVQMCLDIDYEPGAIAAIADLNREFADVIAFNEPMNEAIYADAETGEYCQGVNVAYLERAREMIAAFGKSDKKVIITVSKGMAGYLGVVKDAGLAFDAASSHDYFGAFRRGWRPVADQLAATHEVANYAISLGNYCARHGLQPMATESGWGGLTHLSDQDRVAVCKQIYGRQLAQRGLTHIYKCWFQDTFWKRHGRRHYELVAWDRTLRGEGRLLSDLQRQYGPRDLPINQVEVTCSEGEISTREPFGLDITVRNIAARDRDVTSVVLEGPAEIAIAPGEFERFRLKAGASRQLAATLSLAPHSRPGYYHVFPVVRFDDGAAAKVICGWSVLRHRCFHPDLLDLDRPPYEGVTYDGGVGVLREIDLNRPTTIVVGEKATRKDAEWAYNLHNVLHSVLANDALEIRWELYRRTQPQMFDRNLIVIGSPDSSALMRAYAGAASGPRVVLADHEQRADAKVLLLLGRSRDTYGWQQMELARHDIVEEVDIVCADVLRRFVMLSRYYLSPRLGIVEAFGGLGAADTDRTLT